MRVELYIHGQLYRTWEFNLLEYYDPLCELTHGERKEMWDRILDSCKAEVELVTCSNPHEFYYIVAPRIQPADVGSDEYEKFLPVVIEIENRLKLKEKYG